MDALIYQDAKIDDVGEGVGEGLRRSFATPNLFVLTNKICLNQR